MTAPDRPADPSRPPPAAGAPADSVADARRARTRLGIVTMCGVCLIFAIQDTMSRSLGGSYSPMQIVMLRFWFFAVFALVVVSRSPGGLRPAFRSARPVLQLTRGVLLVVDVTLTVFAFVALGLVNTHAIFAVYPLLIVALSGPMLGEKIGWRRWTAVAVGFAGIMLILRPGSSAVTPAMFAALAAALCFALYGILTRMVSRDDSASTSFLWTSIIGAVAMTPLGLSQWRWLAPEDWALMGLLCLCGAVSHWLLIRAYTMAEASVLQPFAYTQLPWVAVFAMVLFGEQLAPNVAIGIVIVVGAGLFSLWRSRVRSR